MQVPRALEGHLNRCLCVALGLFALVLFGSGCGGSQEGAPPDPAKSAQAGPNTRIKFKDEYKQVLGKDGKLLLKPSETKKLPSRFPKS